MDFNDLEKEISQLTTPPPTQEQQGSKPLTVDLGDGRVYQFKDEADLSANLKQAFNTMSVQISEKDQKLKELEEARLNAPQGQFVQGDREVAPKFDNDTFIKLLSKDAKEALEYAMPHTEAGRNLKKALEEAKEANQQLEAEKFLRNNPEFRQGEDGIKLDKFRQQMGFEFNLQGLEAAYALARQRGIIPDYKMLNQLPQAIQALAAQGHIEIKDPRLMPQNPYQNQQPQYNQPPFQNGYNQIPGNQFQQQWNTPTQGAHPGLPTIPRRNDTSPEMDAAVENLSMEQLEALIKKYAGK